MTLEARKYRLIKLIAELDNELEVKKIEELIGQFDAESKILLKLSKPMKEKLDIEQLMIEQNYKHPSKEELTRIIEQANIEESIEDLLEMI